MSLKAFHVVFVAVSIQLMLFLAWWAYSGFRDSGEGVYLLGSLVSLASVIGLGVYGKYFLKKLKHISYL